MIACASQPERGVLAAPGAAGPVDLATRDHGGRVRVVTSELDDAWPASDLTAPIDPDDDDGRGWQAATTAAQDIVLSFWREREAVITTVVLDPRIGNNHRAVDDNTDPMPRDVEVWVSSQSPTAGFRRVAKALLERRVEPQALALPANTRAKYVEVRVLSTFGGREARLRGLRIQEAPGTSILADLPKLELLSPDLPRLGLIDTAELAELARARPARLDAATPLDDNHDAHQWFAITVPGPSPTVLHVGTQNVALADRDDGMFHPRWVRVFDASGAELLPPPSPAIVREGVAFVDKTRKERLLGRGLTWHGQVGSGRYYVRLDWGNSNIVPKLVPSTARGKQPALLVLSEPVEATRTPTGAAQLGLDYLEVEAVSWQDHQQCMGCHMQGLGLLGMGVAKHNGYRVSETTAAALGEYAATFDWEASGAAQRVSDVLKRDPYSLWQLLAVRYYTEGFAPARAAAIESIATRAFAHPPPSWQFPTDGRLPTQGGPTTANALAVQSLAVLARSASPSSRAQFRAAEQATLELVIASTKRPEQTVQDRTMRIMTFTDAARRDAIGAEVDGLLAMQNADGGWGELTSGGPSNAYGTGQALYGLNLAGFSIRDPRFQRGVTWLMTRQRADGSWPLVETKSQTDVGHCMWAVIGLAGAFDRHHPDKPEPEMLVPVRVTARDARNQHLTDLTATDFTIREDGTVQPIVSVTRHHGDFSVVLMMDNSGSIKDALPLMVDAAKGFIGQFDRADRISLLAFSDRPRPASPFVADRNPVLAALAAMRARGGTALYDSSLAALDALRAQADPRAVVLLTDGRDENGPSTGPGSKASLDATLARLRREHVPFYIVGLGKDVDHRVLDAMAEASGGEAIYVATSDQLEAAYTRLASQLTAQYTVVYRSTHPVADGQFRKLAVTVSRPAAQVDAPAGFYATKDLVK